MLEHCMLVWVITQKYAKIAVFKKFVQQAEEKILVMDIRQLIWRRIKQKDVLLSVYLFIYFYCALVQKLNSHHPAFIQLSFHNWHSQQAVPDCTTDNIII